MGGFKRRVARSLAIFLTTVLLIPSNITVFAAEVGEEFENQKNPVVSEEQKELEENKQQEAQEERESSDTQEKQEQGEEQITTENISEKETISAEEKEEKETETYIEKETGTLEYNKKYEDEKSVIDMEEVAFNTGSKVYHVVSMENFFYNKQGDAYFEEDGSYTIQIPEDNPFFPYEVQFTYNDKIVNQWFLTPDDSVEVGGHTFYVSANFDNTVVTQMNLQIADDVVTVYPEKKEFTDGEGIDPISLLPLTEKRLTVDLSAYTPAELTMVSLDSVFTGEYALDETQKVVWTFGANGDDYLVANAGDIINISCDTYDDSASCQMIVGEADQLAEENIRYIITLDLTPSREWLIPTIYSQDNSGTREEIIVKENYYEDYNFDLRQLRTYIVEENAEKTESIYYKFDINQEVFAVTYFEYFKVYKGQYTSAAEALSGIEITEEICSADMEQSDAGYKIKKGERTWITIVTFDKDNQITGCLPIQLYVTSINNFMSYSSLYKMMEYDNQGVSRETKSILVDECRYVTYRLFNDYAVDDIYYQKLYYYRDGADSSHNVTAAYPGKYYSIFHAEAMGALNIKEDLFENDGYAADYSQGIYFSIFVGNDDDEKQEVYYFYFKTEAGTIPQPTLSSQTAVWFYGLNDKNGDIISSYIVKSNLDSYSEFNYWTILVDEDTDLTSIAPIFYTNSGINLYAEGSSSPEVSGESYHDFSKGYVQYTSAAEDGRNAKNYWVQIVKPSSVAGKLYINSLTDSVADTRTDNNIVYSKREVNLDGYHHYEHNILLMNMGEEAIDSLSVKLISDVLELDDYWTLQGNHSLSGFNGVDETTMYGELSNLAMLRIRAKEGLEGGTEASGQLIIKSGDDVQMVLTLTGIVGDPCITTKEIPAAVKYVPYGTMIQNNNKYGWNQVSYKLISGTLPEGMELKENGELYGVPQEAGEFTFTLSAVNSSSSFRNSNATLTLVVKENTNSNVYTASDNGYVVEQPIGVENIAGSYDYILNEISDQLFISSGEYGEFIDFWLNGVKLVDGEDYTKDSGSTRITIRSQTFRDKTQAGTNTIAAEFRVEGDTSKELKRTAQNFRIEIGQSNDKNNSSDDNTGSNNEYDSSDESDDSDDNYESGAGSNSNSNHNNNNNSNNSNTNSSTNTSSENNIDNIPENNTNIINSDNLWVQDDTGWWCRMSDGSYPKNTWCQMSYKGTVGWYFFNEQGYMIVGWFFNNGQWYYLSPELDDAQGRMSTSWQMVGDNWCYFNHASDGNEGALTMDTWKQLTYNGNTDWYYFDTEGYMAVGWIYENNKWYYLNPASDGTKGKMYTGWQLIDGKWYYFNETTDGTEGTLITDAWIDNYYVDSNGRWTE